MFDLFNNLDIIATEAYKNSVAHGFRGPEVPQSDGRDIALIHTELSEVVEALRHGNPPDNKIPEFSGVEAELADTVIRILDFCRAKDLFPQARTAGFQRKYLLRITSLPDDPISAIASIHRSISDAYSFLEKGDSSLVALWDLAKALAQIRELALTNGYRLDAAVEAKMKFNAARPHMHGGKLF